MSASAETTRPSLATLRARLLALDETHAKGELDDATYATARREAERALSDVVLAAPITTDFTTPPATSVRSANRPSWRLVGVLAVVVVSIAIGGYAFTGSPSLAGLGTPPAPPVVADNGVNAGAGSDRQVGLQQIAEMVDRLALRLKDKPDDAEGWTMLARSYTVLTRYRDALPAYQHAIALQPKNAGLLADYADALAAANDGKATAESMALIGRALAIDPAQPKALALAGTIAFERGDYATAVVQWQKIADALPPDSEFHRQVMADIDEARRRGGLPASAGRATSGASVATAATGSAMVTSAAASGHEALTGIVSLAPGLARQASPNDTVFVLARPENGRMPLAVFRAAVKDLPLRFKLDDTMAMTPTMKISSMKQVIVAARISKSGNAITQPGDLSGETGPVAPGTKDLSIVIGRVVPAK
jgi:cytochrome c-type biogenesis protein CcmH